MQNENNYDNDKVYEYYYVYMSQNLLSLCYNNILESIMQNLEWMRSIILLEDYEVAQIFMR